ncbi:glycosyltransferase family protein [Daejeonella sp.]|uniref:glycosyltransferase family protein n=1 Tax=Daejeonella sp. TaxID=2805397 RepID=UPI0030BAFF32
MRILYAIQGTGNGHLSRATDVIPCLKKHGEVDILVSGSQGDLNLPFPIKYKLSGLSFIFGKSGGVSIWKTLARTNIRKLLRSIKTLPVEEYDLVINDFEPVSAWACYFKNKACISLSHQAAVLSPGLPRPAENDMMGKLILNNYAPSSSQYGFHFSSFRENIFTPVIRREVRAQQITDAGHYTVYLPSYDDERLINFLSEFNDVEWDVFSKHNSRPLKVRNINIQPIDGAKFTTSMASSSGVLCGAGFETPAEALFLGKKLMVIPMKNQYEQHLNAAALQAMKVPVIKNLKPKYQPLISEWLEHGQKIAVNYPDITQKVIDMIVKKHQADTTFDSAETLFI